MTARQLINETSDIIQDNLDQLFEDLFEPISNIGPEAEQEDYDLQMEWTTKMFYLLVRHHVAPHGQKGAVTKEITTMLKEAYATRKK